jgi:uncharacterized FAD-dependent dehydrogenase
VIQSERKYADVLIVGAGPAGLAAATACLSRNAKFIVVDSGSPVDMRDRDNHREICSGVGGAGLFSDGKFSFFPSATNLWTLADRECLGASYAWLARAIDPLGIHAPSFPDLTSIDSGNADRGQDDLCIKGYPSFHMPYENRVGLTRSLASPIRDSLITDTNIKAIRFDAGTNRFVCITSTPGQSEFTFLTVKSVIFAGGRFGPVQWGTIFSDIATVYRRLEVGVRIQQAATDFFLKDDPRLDPKVLLRSNDPRYEWRTFCCCRDGEVMVTRCSGLTSVSGRSDGLKCGQSNVGFHVRISDQALGTELWPHVLQTLRNLPLSAPMPESLPLFLADGLGNGAKKESKQAAILGPRVARLVAEGLDRLRKSSLPFLDDDALVIAPALEGVAFYPEVDAGLRCGALPLWVVGDATGLFRGLSAAMISGYYAGTRASDYLGSQT